jgi:hypothetical protein
VADLQYYANKKLIMEEEIALNFLKNNTKPTIKNKKR